MAEALWLARRATRLQDECLEAIASGDKEAAKTARADVALYLRYQTTHERSYQRFAAELRKLQNDRNKTELGFVSQKRKEAEDERKQQKHEAAQAYQKSRTDHQLMKNRLLSEKVRLQDEHDKRRIEDEEWKKQMDKRRQEELLRKMHKK
jgi:hypothetical protein